MMREFCVERTARAFFEIHRGRGKKRVVMRERLNGNLHTKERREAIAHTIDARASKAPTSLSRYVSGIIYFYY
jgi:hypothetical protein